MLLRIRFVHCLLVLCFFAPLPCRAGTYDKLTLVSINLIDRNGLSETIGSKEKLRQYAKVDFLAPQPYQKVMRVYKNAQGENVACLTTYHLNGQLKQYLECVNNRACGRYREWYDNGQLKIHAHIVGGVADLHPSAEASWQFDGKTLAYSDEGNLEANIYYRMGSLEGSAFYYHPNGNVWKSCSYHKNALDGEFLTFTAEGHLLKKQMYHQGELHGLSQRYEAHPTHEDNRLLSEEEYKHGALISGTYLCPRTYEEIATVTQGHGTQLIYGHHAIVEIRTIKQGRIEGGVQCFDSEGKRVTQTYSLSNGLRHGEEYFFYPDTTTPKLMLTWHEGVLQGTVKTWYPSGTLESCKELIQNKKSGLLTIYYPSGQIMATEEYDQDLLVKGEYFRLGDKLPYTKVDKGCGVAVFFTPSGLTCKKIHYQDGKPLIHTP